MWQGSIRQKKGILKPEKMVGFLQLSEPRWITDLSRIIDGTWEHTNVPVKSSKEMKSAAIYNFKKFSKLSRQEKWRKHWRYTCKDMSPTTSHAQMYHWLVKAALNGTQNPQPSQQVTSGQETLQLQYQILT